MHLEHVMKAFDILQHHQFFIKANKCVFGQHELEYLRHIMTNQWVKVDQGKIEVMINWPWPNDIFALHGFLGLTSYYRKFVRNYGLIARILTNLLKKGQFKWNDEAKDAFHKLKHAMTSTPILVMSNFNEPFIVETDASEEGISVVLT